MRTTLLRAPGPARRARRWRGHTTCPGPLKLGGKFVLDLCHHYGRFLFFGRFWRSGFRVTTDKSEPDKRNLTVSQICLVKKMAAISFLKFFDIVG